MERDTRRSFKRLVPDKSYRKLFLIAVEGHKTESGYFEKLFRKDIIKICCLKDKKHNSPLQVLGRLKKEIKGKSLRKNDEAWVVVDKEDWTEEQLAQLYQWSQQDDRYGFALLHATTILTVTERTIKERCVERYKGKNAKSRIEEANDKLDKSPFTEHEAEYIPILK